MVESTQAVITNEFVPRNEKGPRRRFMPGPSGVGIRGAGNPEPETTLPESPTIARQLPVYTLLT